MGLLALVLGPPSSRPTSRLWPRPSCLAGLLWAGWVRHSAMPRESRAPAHCSHRHWSLGLTWSPVTDYDEGLHRGVILSSCVHPWQCHADNWGPGSILTLLSDQEHQKSIHKHIYTSPFPRMCETCMHYGESKNPHLIN